MGQAELVESKKLESCRHCGTEFRAYTPDDAYCCSGCEYVYKLIHEENLDRFYDFQNSQSSPVGFSVFASKDFQWLQDTVSQIDSMEAGTPRITLAVSGISCIGCVWLIEQLFSKQPGGRQCRINVQRGEIQLEWTRGSFDIARFAHELHRFGYDLFEKREEVPSENSKLVWCMGLCGAFALNGMLYTLPSYLGMKESFLFSTHFNWLSGIFATLSMLIGGSYFIHRTYAAARSKIVHMDLPISLGLVVAYSASVFVFLKGGDPALLYFDFISTFVFLMLCGKWLQIFAIERNRNRLSRLEVEPPKVDKIANRSRILKFDSRYLENGDRYFLNPGSWVPVDSKLVSEKANQGMDWINGESDPRLFLKGSRIPSGSINQSASQIELIAETRWEESLLYELLNSREEKSDTDTITQLWITRYLLAVMLIAFVGSIAWMTLGSLPQAMIVFVSALVVSCPCALGVALPLANELAVSKLKLKGVFVRTASLWNRLIQVSQVVFDKTGTLTRSTMDWINPEIISCLGEEAVEALSALTQNSRHPVATTVHEVLFTKGCSKSASDWDVKEILGQGMIGTKNGATWRLGKSDWAADTESNATILSKNGIAVASLHFEDRPWSDAATEIEALKKKGFLISILSGDKVDKVQRAARTLGIENEAAIGDASPQMKQQWLHEHNGSSTLILGDGANDSLAFDEALCCGTPAAEKTTLASKADFYYLGAGIQGVRSLFDIASKRRSAIRALMAFALTYNFATISLALAGIVTPLLAAILMPLSSIVSIGIVWAILRT